MLAGTFRLFGFSCGHAPTPKEILSASLRNIEDADVTNTLAIWNSLAKSTEPSEASKHLQRPWDSHVTTTADKELLVNCSLPVDEARLKAIITSHAGDWLHAPPLTAVGLRLSDEAVRVAAGFRLDNNICQPHVCVCSETVDARGLHSLV